MSSPRKLQKRRKRTAKKEIAQTGGIAIEYGVLASGLSIALALSVVGTPLDLASLLHKLTHII